MKNDFNYVYMETKYAHDTNDFMKNYLDRVLINQDEPLEDESVPESFMIMFLTRLFVDDIAKADFEKLDNIIESVELYPAMFRLRKLIKDFISEENLNYAIDLMLYFNVAPYAFHIYIADAFMNAIECIDWPEEKEDEE